jgi:hypothetical protein
LQTVQTHLPTGKAKKVLQMRAFARSGWWIRTHDLLHGKQWLAIADRREMPANPRIRAVLMPG